MKPLRVLIVEDVEDDAILIVRQLRKGGFDTSFERVETDEDMRAAVGRQEWDLVIADYTLPNFNARAALTVMQELGADLPFIIVSGSIGEDTAVAAMKAGAHDYMLKENLTRLAPVVERELREAHIRRERREALAQVEESEQRLGAILSQVAVGIVQTSLDGRLLSANQRFCEMVGRARDDIIGLHAQDLIHPDEVAATAAIFERVAAGERDFVTESRYLRPDRSDMWVNSTLSVVNDRQGRPSYVVAVVQDVTDRKRAEEELREAVRARDEFLSIASHELKTPITPLELQLTSVLGLVREGRLGEVPPEKLESKLEMAVRQIDRLTALINNMLDVTRITSGRLTLARRRLDLRDSVRAVVARSREMIKRSHCPLVITADEEVVGYWDPIGLETVVSNLLSNATKFGEGQPIEIAIDRVGDAARIVVRDHGIGIAPEEQTRIFQRFERAVPARHYGGFGIGLWAARQIIEAHGGAIHVASEPGAGSTFTIELPVGGAAESGAGAPSPGGGAGAASEAAATSDEV
ncbi:MAG TPA: ATP-binding protein [Kofleriaceae bacterium]|nr:ATP-binding protein [Kofleriaceae bacterium]